MSDLESILEKHGLRKTAFRKELLAIFNNSNATLTVEEIRSKVTSTNDKVTVYRALDAFEKSGIIHKVPDKNNLTRYALCPTKCTTHNHVHNHAHFICDDCDKTFCIDEIEVPKVKETNGFTIKSSKLTLQGSCPDCAS
ncbi:Fur family transcriptional regulator [Wenyingzhuangia sp. IMCC45574]